MTFTKLDRGLLQSSVLAEDAVTFKVWIVLLAACDDDGIARVSPVFVSSIARLPMDSIETAIKRLSAPDPASRSTVAKGRRIRRIDGGFEVINYLLYRSTSLRDAEAERKRLYRQRKKSPSSIKKDKEDKRGENKRRPDNVRTPGPLPLPKNRKRVPQKGNSLPSSPKEPRLIEEEIPKGLAFKDGDELRELKREHNDLIRLAGNEEEMGRRGRNRADVLAKAARVRERFEQVKADTK